MSKYFIVFVFFMGVLPLKAQNISAPELLDKAIAFHDPNGLWSRLQGKLFISMSYPDGRERHSEIKIDLPKQYFELTSTTEGNTLVQIIDKEDCVLKLNGSTKISEKDLKAHRLSCERAQMMKNYYLYLYGLPMKLKDDGTFLDAKVQRKAFKGKEYLVLKVSYDESVGKDIWYFYFDPVSYAMEVYQFFHDESINDGEYILLSELETIGTIKMPKKREWYYNKDDKHLGTDTLTKTSILN